MHKRQPTTYMCYDWISFSSDYSALNYKGHCACSKLFSVPSKYLMLLCPLIQPYLQKNTSIQHQFVKWDTSQMQEIIVHAFVLQKLKPCWCTINDFYYFTDIKFFYYTQHWNNGFQTDCTTTTEAQWGLFFPLLFLSQARRTSSNEWAQGSEQVLQLLHGPVSGTVSWWRGQGKGLRGTSCPPTSFWPAYNTGTGPYLEYLLCKHFKRHIPWIPHI